jgi:hypothetical protein
MAPRGASKRRPKSSMGPAGKRVKGEPSRIRGPPWRSPGTLRGVRPLMAGYTPIHPRLLSTYANRTAQRKDDLVCQVQPVIPWSPRRRVAVSAGPTKLPADKERCWADGPGGQQCDAVIDSDDFLGLCEPHRALLRE